jgi:hypothetical protein
LATRRKYKNPQGYRDGGRVAVLDDMSIPDDEPAEAGGFPAGILGTEASRGIIETPREPPATGVFETPVAEPATDDNPLQRALDAQTRAEEMQRQRAQQPPPSAIEQRIEKIPNLTEHKRAFLRQFPVLLEDPITQQIFNRHYVEALQNGGFTDDTAALDNHLIAATAREIEQRRQAALAHESVDEAVQKLDDEIEANRRSEQPPPIAPPSPPPAPRRSVPMSAPVSRESPMWSGQRRNDENNTLRADEREIARVSFPHLPASQAEYEYLKNKRLMIQRKANGEIQGDR